MSNFFTKSDGKRVEQTTSFDAGGGDFDLIPNNTALLAAIAEAKWASYEGEPDYINLKWSVMLPEKYRGRVIFQKIKVNDASEKTSDKAKDMFVTIDTLAGGKLFKAGVEPDDVALMAALSQRAMMIQVMVWEIKTKKDPDTGEEIEAPKEEWKSGNWIRAVDSKDLAKEAISRQQAEREMEEKSQATPAPVQRQRAAAPAAAAGATPRPRPAPRTAPAARTAPEPTPDPTPDPVETVDHEPDLDNFDDDIPF